MVPATNARYQVAGADRCARTGRIFAGETRRVARCRCGGRHSALGDAVTTARIFLALVPKLRDHGIRTVAEAERACGALSGGSMIRRGIGWIEAVETPARIDAEQTLKRFDSYAYRHRNRDIMRMPPVFVARTQRSATPWRGWRAKGYRRLYVAIRKRHAAASRRPRRESSPNAICCARSTGSAPQRSNCRSAGS